MPVHKAADASNVKVVEREVPSFFVDGPLGSAWANGVHRVLLGEFVTDPTIGAESPAVQHVLNLVMTTDTVQRLIQYLEDLPGVRENEE